MLSNLLLIVLMIGGAFAAPWKSGVDFSAASSQVSQGTANTPLPDVSTVDATLDLNMTTSISPGSVFSSLTSIFPISLPPDTLNSILLPPPPTSLPASKSLPSLVSASTSSESPPAPIPFSILSTISIGPPSKSVLATGSSAAASTTPAVATSPKSGPATSTTRTSISILTITETETRTFFGTNSRNGSHTNPPFTFPGGSRPTTLQTSAKINSSSIYSASGPQGTRGTCLKDTDRWCPPNMNNSQGPENSSGINQPLSNDFRVDVTVNGGDFKGGKPFNSSGTYHGNGTNGILDTGMGSMDVHEPCGRDLMCLAGVLMASLSSVVTEIMNPTPKGTVPIWCPNDMGDTKSSTKMSGSGSDMPWSASETGKWNTSMASRTIITAPEAPSNTQIQPTGTPGVPDSPPTTIEPLPSSLSPGVIGTPVPTDTGSIITDTGLPTLNQRSVRTSSSENAAFSSNLSLLASMLSSDAASMAATASKKPTIDSQQDGWSEWRTAGHMPTITQRAVPTTTESMNSDYMPSIAQRQLITTTVSNSYTTATYDYWELSPFTWSENSVQVSEALTMLLRGTPTPKNTA